MAKQAGKAQQNESRPANRPGQSSPPSGSARGTGAQRGTGERDENYNLISVLYHALQGAETIGKYLGDVQGDEELMEFFEETRAEYVARAQQAKELLASRLSDEEEDEEDEEDEEE
jgi:hypothetical protein